jgi:IS30 family transposase
MYEFEGVDYVSRSAMCAARRERYYRLLLEGYNSTTAAHMVGTTKRTAKRWRHGRKRKGKAAEPVYIPDYDIGMENKIRDGYFLGLDERIAIADGLVHADSLRTIAHTLHRSPSTISREVARGLDATGRYNPYGANNRSLSRFKRPKPRKVDMRPELWDYILSKLKVHWSPEQISASLERDFPYDKGMRLSHEAIYQAIFIQAKGPLKDELKACMRQGRCVRRQHGRTPKPRFREPMVMISERPAEIADRAVPGHWEGDLIVGAHNRSAIGTLVERTTRFCMLLHLPFDHTALSVQDAVADKMSTLPTQLRRSLTWDQGVEMALHAKIGAICHMQVYFCDPHSPWQRGTNENTNGLLRQYFPKGTDLSIYSEADLDDVAAELNDRIRKTLDWKSPAECLSAILSGT